MGVASAEMSVQPTGWSQLSHTCKVLITSGLDVAQDMICSSIPAAHLLLSCTKTTSGNPPMKQHNCQVMRTAAASSSCLRSPSAAPSRPWPPAPGRERRMILGRWRRGPAPPPPSPWWRSSPATPTRWRSTRPCPTRAGSDADWVARGADTAAGPGEDPQPGKPGTACRGCGSVAHRKPREAEEKTNKQRKKKTLVVQ